MKGGLSLAMLFAAASLGAPAQAQESDADKQNTSFGLAPGAPQVRSAPPNGVIPNSLPATTQDWAFDFHGYLTLPAVVGKGKRAEAGPEQSKTALHSPAILPTDRDRFQFTGADPNPWVQMNFSYGTTSVVGTVVIGAYSVGNAAAFFNPPAQQGVTDALVTLHVPDLKKARVDVNVGAFSNRYGFMGEYDLGRYATPIIARINSVGETITASLDLSENFSLAAEEGFGGQLGRVGDGTPPTGYNDFAAPAGTSFVGHLHLGANYANMVRAGVHYIHAWEQDDQISTTLPDGSLDVVGGDLRFSLRRYGHLYLAGSRAKASTITYLGNVIEILNSRGGAQIIKNYLGPNSNGNGSITTVGAQYDVSLVRAFYAPVFDGRGPDIYISLFGVTTKVKSDDKSVDAVYGRKLFDNVGKLKYGGEVTYSMLPWLAVSGRFDRVVANDRLKDSFTSISPRIILHTDWMSQEQIVLQYSRYFYANGVIVRQGYPPVDNPSVVPDRHVFSLTANMWW
jgi:hypothetical protein